VNDESAGSAIDFGGRPAEQVQNGLVAGAVTRWRNKCLLLSHVDPTPQAPLLPFDKELHKLIGKCLCRTTTRTTAAFASGDVCKRSPGIGSTNLAQGLTVAVVRLSDRID
jgi:hypothetical protein